jgi:hypothetical protein
MMKQSRLSDLGFAGKTKQVRGERFLAEIAAITRWAAPAAGLIARCSESVRNSASIEQAILSAESPARPSAVMLHG